jgi:hypothetical protein
VSDRKVQVCMSKDGGHTWGNWRETSLGELGEYRTRARFRRWGHGRQFVMKVRVTSPIKADLMTCYGEIEAGE